MSQETVEIVRRIYGEGLIDRELFDFGDTVVAAVRHHAGPASSSEVQAEAHTWTFREGKVTRFDRGLNLENALEAAGPSE